MRSGMKLRGRVARWGLRWTLAVTLFAPSMGAQTDPYERTFPQSKVVIEKTLKTMQTSLGGHLPVLDGFAQSAEHPLDRYQRGYYQTAVQVTAIAAGGSVVRVSTKVTAWYSDPAAAHSGYQLLTSNGRLETDLLDQLAEQLAKDSTGGASTPTASTKTSPAPATAAEPKASAPSASADSDRSFSSSLSQSLAAQEHANRPSAQATAADKATAALQAEAKNLEEILKNQAHPKNLVAVKKSGTPVVDAPSLTAKPQFLASMHDEFEMLDFSADWVHVRVSGLSRGWIWRNSVEMPEGIPDSDAPAISGQAAAADLFHVLREETAQFPGDWEPLRGKNVKIISVQRVDENSREVGQQARLGYAKFLLEKSVTEMAQAPQELAGVVLIFDSADGGMIAATLPVLQQWRAGKLSDSAFWHKCFFDPPEIFGSTGSSSSP